MNLGMETCEAQAEHNNFEKVAVEKGCHAY